MVSRQAMAALGGFDERFHPAWFEDVDLCRRIRDLGGRIRFVPDARFLHLGGHTLDRLGRGKFLEYFHSNQIRYFDKHHGAAQAERVRKLIVAGLSLRAALAFLRKPTGCDSRKSSSRMFWKAARHFGSKSGGGR